MPEALDLREIRDALGAFATGVTIITTSLEGEPTGITANSFNSVSLDPPMVLWSLGKSSYSLPIFDKAGNFAVHILAEDQQSLSTRFATRGGAKFENLQFEWGRAGLPLIEGCVARFQCRKVFAYEGGDHIIFVGEIEQFENAQKAPLLFHRGQYAVAASRSPGVAWDELEPDDSLSHLITRTNLILRGGSLAFAEQLDLSLPERYLVGVLLGRGGCTLDAANDTLAYMGLVVEPTSVDRLLLRGMIARSACDNGAEELSLTAAGRDAVIAMLTLTKVRNKEVEIQLGKQGPVLKQLLKQLISVGGAVADGRITQHVETLRKLDSAED